MDDHLLKKTSSYFDAINFNELNERWVDAVADSEFTDCEENRMTTSILFSQDPIQSLLNLCSICKEWCDRPATEDELADESSFVINMSSRPETMLWTYLNQMDISIRQIQAFIYFLCHRALKTSSSLLEKEYGLISAKLYFCCLKVPGSSAYSVYFANLFTLCVDCFQIPDILEGKDAIYRWDHFAELMPNVISSLVSLVPLLKVFHLGNDTSAADNTVRKLTDLIVCETSNTNIDFASEIWKILDKDRQRLRMSRSAIIVTLAFQGLNNLLHSEVNGDREHTYAYTLSCLNRHILCTRVRKSQTIPSKFLVIKENAVLFICYNLRKSSELCSPLTVTTLKRLCLTVIDKAEFRSVVALSIFRIAHKLPIQYLADFIKWLLLLADSSETHNRVIALEILGHMITDTSTHNTDELDDENLKVYLTPIPLIFSILTRCDDVSPHVRTKALSVLSQNMDKMLNVLKHVGDPEKFPVEEFDEDVAFEMNGEHRSFWYSFPAFKPMLDEIAALFHRRIDDNNGTARKAALQALESIITFDLEYLSEDNLKLFMLAARDPNILIRKHMIQSLTTVLEKYHYNELAQNYWIKCILPLVQDPENSVQAKVLSVLEDKFLAQIFSQSNDERNCAFNLLGKLSCGEFLSHQRYLQKAFSLWKVERKLRPQMITRLKPFFDGKNDELLWLYVSLFSAFCDLPPGICELAVEEYERSENWKSFSFIENILKVIRCTFSSLTEYKLNNVREVLMKKLEEFAAPVEILPMMIEILGKIEKYLNNEKEFLEFASKLMKLTVDTLVPYVTKGSSKTLPSGDDAIKSFTIIKEVCHLYPEHISQHLLKVLKCFVYSSLISDSSSERRSQISKRITTPLRAHAFAALGKISLQDEELAKDLLPLLAREIVQSEENVIRNNVVIILIEMCKRYTSYADKYVRLISMCFKDPVYLVRFQAITLIVSLLQEDYIKWKGCLLFCLLSTLIDAKESIQELGKYCLGQLLYEKRKSIFSDCFVDAIFVFNHYLPPDNVRLSEVVEEMPRFALKGDSKQELRMHIYKFMLSYMEPAARAYLVKSLCQEILSSVADGVYPLNKVTESMVKDCFAIISSKEIRAYDTDSIANEVEETEEETVTKAELVARKVMIVQPVIPVIISLKNCVMEGKSELLSDIVMFLKEILNDYQSDIETLLRDDKMLLMQVKFEIRNEAVHQERKAKEKREAARQQQQNAAPPRSRDRVAEEIKETTAYILQQEIGNDASMPANAADRPAEGSLRLLPKTPSKPVQKQATQNENGNDDRLSAAESLRQLIPQYQSTPRVVLKPLKLAGLTVPNISRIRFDEEDQDS